MPRGERILLASCLLLAAVLFLTGITWGLPTRAADPYLFGDRTPWTGRQIIDLTGNLSTDPTKGADVDLNPLLDRTKPIVLNATDAQRAEIVRRYRLFTYQPDEWNTMRSLAGMKPGVLQLDPKLYQYGGLWVYPVGALLKLGSMLGLIHLTPDLGHYMDHPEAFARFYVVARLYSALWGVVGAWAVYLLARKLTRHMVPAAIACVCWGMMPVVVTMAHEAKPHLAGLSLMLLAILAACRYVETGAPRWWVITGALCGAAFGMVISSLIIFFIVPLMTVLRPMAWPHRVRVALLAGAAGMLVYAITNPYVWINLIRNPDVLRSNLGTSTAMYHATPGSGLVNAIRLVAEGTSPLLAVAGVAGALLLLWRRRPSHVAWILGAPAGVVVAQFIALAAGKPAEYARFALLPDTALCVAAIVAGWLVSPKVPLRVLAMIAMVAAVAPRGGAYLAHFIADSASPTGRIRYAEQLQSYSPGGFTRIALLAEPAPYVMPPVDLWRWELVLLPRDNAVPKPGDVFVRVIDQGPRAATPISWAAKPSEIHVAETPSQK